MDSRRFDAFTKAWGSAANRRRVLVSLLAATGLLGWRRAAAQQGESACAHFCQGLPPGPERGQCAKDCATGVSGLFEACGEEPTRLCPGGVGATGGCCEAGQWCCAGAQVIPHCCNLNQFCCGPLSCDRDPDDHTQCIPPPA
jgi:hypothetical protein